MSAAAPGWPADSAQGFTATFAGGPLNGVRMFVTTGEGAGTVRYVRSGAYVCFGKTFRFAAWPEGEKPKGKKVCSAQRPAPAWHETELNPREDI
jgi:hypothetical protein